MFCFWCLHSRYLKGGSEESFFAISRKDVGDLLKIDVRFNGIPYIERWHLESAVVKSAWKDQE